MSFMWGMFSVLFGAFFIYIGSMMIIGSMLPSDLARTVGYEHGKWVREKIVGAKDDE